MPSAIEPTAKAIAVVARFKQRVRSLADTLEAAGVRTGVLDGDADAPGVRVATMHRRVATKHRVKGLDFTHVIMEQPAAASTDPRETSSLYVAAIRPRRTLTVLRAA